MHRYDILLLSQKKYLQGFIIVFTGNLITLNIRKRKSKSLDRVDNLILILIIDMKTLNLTLYGVKEMNETQMSEVNGGGGVLWLVIGLIVSEMLDRNARRDFADGMQMAEDFWC